MATSSTPGQLALPPDPPPESPAAQLVQQNRFADPSADNPIPGNPGQAPVPSMPRFDPLRHGQALIEIRKTYLMQYQPKRQLFLRRALRSFEVLKGNPYVTFNENAADFDTISQIVEGTLGDSSIQLQQRNDNIYQMFCLAFIATLSVDVGKARFQPGDADDERDLLMAKKASTIHAYNERRNDIAMKQKLELLYLWTCGAYFCYVRHVIDKRRAGSTMLPIVKPAPIQVFPDRYVCPQCGQMTPESRMGLRAGDSPRCPGCGTNLGQENWYQAQTIIVPTIVGQMERADGMTAFDILSGVNITTDPDAMELVYSHILDYTVDTNVASVRSAFPDQYANIQAVATGDGTVNGDMSRRVRDAVTSPDANANIMTTQGKVAYSRCWMQTESFSVLEDKQLAMELKQLFPNGAKLILHGAEQFLDAVPEAMLDHWTWCPTIKGLGMHPFGVGDCVMDLQERIVDVATIVHAYAARIAFGTILYDADVIDGDALADRILQPGNMTPVTRRDDEGMPTGKLEDLMFQPEFHIDPHLFELEDKMIQRAQVLCGVMPQTFGGSDPNVKTMGGQAQALKTALGRLQLFIDQMRTEKAARAELSVKCSIENMDDQIRVTSPGRQPGDFETERILKNELAGQFYCYPETDEGYPATFEEIQSRIMQIIGMTKDNKFLDALLADPDIQKTIARYILPEDIDYPGDEERGRLKILMQQLSKGEPTVGPPGPDGTPTLIPSVLPSKDYDDFAMGVQIAKKWLQTNFQQDGTAGFLNILAFLRVCVQYDAQAQAKQQLQMAAAVHANGAPAPAQLPAPVPPGQAPAQG